MQTVSLTNGGRTYILKLEPPYDILFDSSSLPTPHLGRINQTNNMVATTDGYLVACSLNNISIVDQEGLVRMYRALSDSTEVSLVGDYVLATFPNNTVDDSAMDVVALWDAAGQPTAVVRTRGQVYVFDLQTGTLRWQDDVPDPTSFCRLQCETMSNPMAVTPTRVVSIANAGLPYFTYPPVGWPGGGYYQTWPHGFVAISDLSDGQLLGQHGFGCGPTSSNCSPTLCSDPVTAYDRSHLHDVTVTPNQRQAIVSGWGVIGIYDLSTGLELKKFDDGGNVYPRMGMLSHLTNRHTLNSVAASDKYAIIAGCSQIDDNPDNQDTALWRVVLVKLDPAADPTNPTWNNSTIQLGPVRNGGPFPARAHDVKITPNQRIGVVSVGVPETLVFSLTGGNAHNSVPLIYATDVDPLLFPSSNPTTDVWMSDSLALTDTRAVVIGKDSSANGGKGAINIIDLTLLPTDPLAVVKINLGSEYTPTDVSMSPTGTRCLVRSVKNGAQLGSPGVAKITVLDPNERVVLATFTSSPVGSPLLGYAYGVNHIIAGESAGVSGGEDTVYPGAPGGPTVNPGQVQVINLDPEGPVQ